MPNDGLSQLAYALLASAPGWGLQNPRGDQDITPRFDASVDQPLADPRMERPMPGYSPMELDPQNQVDRWLGILRSLPQRT
jgi:hypothetical protein